MRFRNPWWIVAGSVMGLIVGNGPLMQFAFGVFLKPLADDLQASRAVMSVAVLVGLATTGLFTPVAGLLVDRFGVRAVSLCGITLFALAIAALSLSPASPWAFIALYGVVGAIAAGQTPLPYAKAVAGAFEARRGLALGISMAGVGLGTALVPQLAQALVTAYGWRQAYVGLGVFVFVCAFPAAYLFLRDPAEGRASTAAAARDGVSGRAAVGTRDFWFLAVAFFAVSMATSGAIAHVVPILTDRGVPPQIATGAISAAGIAMIVGRLLAGYLLDRIFAPYVAFALFLMPLLGICLLFVASAPPVAILATVCVGLGLGAEIDLIAFFISRYFGMRAFGQIYGYLFGIFLIASGFGPFLMGLSFTRTGSYGLAIAGFAVGLVVACALVLMFGEYRFTARAHDRGAVDPLAAQPVLP